MHFQSSPCSERSADHRRGAVCLSLAQHCQAGGAFSTSAGAKVSHLLFAHLPQPAPQKQRLLVLGFLFRQVVAEISSRSPGQMLSLVPHRLCSAVFSQDYLKGSAEPKVGE